MKNRRLPPASEAAGLYIRSTVIDQHFQGLILAFRHGKGVFDLIQPVMVREDLLHRR
jgi:hypothetical protein